VKGGAGFLQLHELVECCHIAENVFDILRKGERRVDSELMDVVLEALDTVNSMFGQVRERTDLTPATPELLAALSRLAEPQSNDAVAEPVAEVAEVAAPVAEAAGGDDITDHEFEQLLDSLHGSKPISAPAAAPAAQASSSDEITDQEFECLLDELHGKGKFEPEAIAAKAPAPAAAAAPAPAAKPAAAPAPAAKAEAAPAKAAAPAPARAPAPTGEKPVATEAETTVRVDTARLDEIMNMVGELVLVRNRLVRLGLNSGDEAMSKAVSNLDVVTADLQTAVMKTRMQPIKKVFGRFPRLVRDLARQLKKEIILELVGEETDLDKNLVEALADPLVHLVRNAVDHGIETPEEREATGKSRGGKVILAAEQEGDHILLSISDDGKGMDPNVLRSIAVKRGVMDKDAADRLSDTDCYNLIFAPGFSTKTEISDVSGRGVGMDVVKTKISQLNGSINIDSTKGQGSKIVIKVPLTLAIMPTLMVMLGNQAFAFPLVNVNEIFHLDLSTTNVV
ncbi:chemotaxis protein CheA, partial [Pseudomonas viridiflava]|uniref:chemotaxis protein CheA n=1 Tax=Pseudomonas viridiflava TaxID=33069 RepID=UPI0013CE6E13